LTVKSKWYISIERIGHEGAPGFDAVWMVTMTDDIELLANRLEPGCVVTDRDVIEGYRRDRADLVESGVPKAVVRAGTVQDVSSTLAWANRRGISVVPRGAGSGLSGGANAIDGCIVLSLERLKSIRRIDAKRQCAVVEAGVINADLGREASKSGLFYPPDPGSFEICTIGGNLATNAGGMRCVKYGVTRDSALGLEIVLADGTILNTGTQAIKDVAGYDLTSLFIGSEGTLGVITAATMRLRPAPLKPPVTFVASFPTTDAVGQAVSSIQASGLIPSLLEFIDNLTINAIEDFRRMDLDRSSAALLLGQSDGEGAEQDVGLMMTLCRDAGADFVVRSNNDVEADMLLEARRLAGTAVMAAGPTVIEDVGVPPGELPGMLDAIRQLSQGSGIPVATTGHVGDGNLHPCLRLPSLSNAVIADALELAKTICAAAIERGGTITGEHGVGVLKRSWLQQQIDPSVIAVHRSVKAALDPANILNPGRAF
jgi:glycolate dehydrogenase FAD-linked subunit